MCFLKGEKYAECFETKNFTKYIHFCKLISSTENNTYLGSVGRISCVFYSKSYVLDHFGYFDMHIRNEEKNKNVSAKKSFF